MKPEIRSPGRSTVLVAEVFQPSCLSVPQSRLTTSVRFRASSEESSPQAYETKISGVVFGRKLRSGSDLQAAQTIGFVAKVRVAVR